MKHLKKKLRKKTVEAYACSHCGTPNNCIADCAAEIIALNSRAAYYADALTSGR